MVQADFTQDLSFREARLDRLECLFHDFSVQANGRDGVDSQAHQDTVGISRAQVKN